MATQKNIARQAEIISCARTLFKINGYEKTTIRGITKKMNFKNQASFYMYFKSKKNLASSIMNEHYAKINDYIDKYVSKQESAIVLLSLRNIIINNSLKDKQNRQFFTELNLSINYEDLCSMNPRLTADIDEACVDACSTLTTEEVGLNMFIYLKGLCSALHAIDNYKIDVDLDKFLFNISKNYLDLLDFDFEQRTIYFSRACALFRDIMPEYLSYLSIII